MVTGTLKTKTRKSEDFVFLTSYYPVAGSGGVPDIRDIFK
jgi:hypothetical protein